MTTFYASSQSKVSHIDRIKIVKDIVGVLKQFSTRTLDTLSTKIDFFWKDLSSADGTLSKLPREVSR